jgi:hypothetical protein
LARAVPEKKFAREIMNTVADRLKELHS